MYTHSYVLTGLPEHDVLYQFSHGQIIFSSLGVRCFFAISGYLITISLLHSRGLPDYFFKRIIRVFPALWVVIGITMLGGYFLAHKSAATYFTDPTVVKYSLNAVLRLHPFIDGVFEHNPFKQYINGSLWTVPYEFLMYVILSAFYFLRHNKVALRLAMCALLGVLVPLQIWHHYIYIRYLELSYEQTIFFALFFFGGALLALFDLPSERMRNVIVAVITLALVTTMLVGDYEAAQFVLLPPLVIYLGTLRYRALGWVRRIGDLSYGIYIWGFPVQQLTWYLLHPSQVEMTLISIPVTYVLAYTSWHLLEKKVLRLKRPMSQPKTAPVLA